MQEAPQKGQDAETPTTQAAPPARQRQGPQRTSAPQAFVSKPTRTVILSTSPRAPLTYLVTDYVIRSARCVTAIRDGRIGTSTPTRPRF